MHLLQRDMSGKHRLPECGSHTTNEQLKFDESLNPAINEAWTDIKEAYTLIDRAMRSLSGQHKDVRYTFEVRKHYLNDGLVNADGQPMEDDN